MSPGTSWHKIIVQVSQVCLEDSWHATVVLNLCIISNAVSATLANTTFKHIKSYHHFSMLLNTYNLAKKGNILWAVKKNTLFNRKADSSSSRSVSDLLVFW